MQPRVACRLWRQRAAFTIMLSFCFSTVTGFARLSCFVGCHSRFSLRCSRSPTAGRFVRLLDRRDRFGTSPLSKMSANIDIQESQRQRALVSPQWLEDNLDKCTVLDVRGIVDKTDLGDGETETKYVSLREDYDNGHIPGAAFVDWTKDIVDTDCPVPVQLASADSFAAAMEERGVGNDKTVVVYDGGKMLFATRLWWALTLYGHPDVRVLDGGWARWTAEGRDSDWDEGCPLKMYSSFEASELLPWLRSDVDDVISLVEAAAQGADPASSTQIIDARSRAQWLGKERRGPRAGRIPGARSVPYKTLQDKSGGYLAKEEMRRVFEESGVRVDPKGTFLCYCNGGVASTAVLFGLWQLGVPLAQLSNYDGSWGEWGRGDYPLETDAP